MPSGSGSTSLHTDMRTGSAPSTTSRSYLDSTPRTWLLVAREPAHVAGVLGEEVRAVGDALLVDGGAQRLRELGRGLQRVALDDLVADDDHGPLGLQQPPGEAVEHRVGGARARIDPRRGAELDAGLGVEDVARQRDEDRAGRRRHRHLGGAAHDARQVLQARHLDRPFHQRLGDRHQRIVEQRLGEAVALLLLAGGQDHRRARELGVVERAHGVAEPGRHVHVAGDELAAGARVAVRHGHHERLLQAQHVGEVRVLLQRMHDGQLGGARIAEQMRDALVLQEREEGGAAGDAVHGGHGGGASVATEPRQATSGGAALRRPEFSGPLRFN